MQNFDNMVNMLADAQQPMLIVTGLEEKQCTGDFVCFDHIVVPDGKGIISFDYRDRYDCLYGFKSYDISFEDAVASYTSKVIRCQGSMLRVLGL